MKTIEIKGHLRESLGSKTAKQLRREGQVPCVLYGGEAAVHFHADERELNKLIYTANVYQVALNLDGKMFKAVMREPQFHPVEDNLLHLDFIEIIDGKPVTMLIPVTLTGNSIGVRNGGILRRNAKKLAVKGLIDNLPDEIEVNIASLRIGQMRKVSELSIPNVEFMEAGNRIVVSIKTSRKAVADTGEEEETAEAAGEAPAEESAAE